MEFRYKPAKLAKEIDLRIEGDRILQIEPSGRILREVPIAGIQCARWHQTYTRPFITRSLDLVTAEGTMNITQAASAFAGPDDPTVRAYTNGVRAALTTLDATRPDLRVEQGQPLLVRWLRFVTFLVISAIVTAPLSMVLERRDANELWWVTALLGGTVLFCIAAAWRSAPWRKLPEIPARELAAGLGGESLSGAGVCASRPA